MLFPLFLSFFISLSSYPHPSTLDNVHFQLKIHFLLNDHFIHLCCSCFLKELRTFLSSITFSSPLSLCFPFFISLSLSHSIPSPYYTPTSHFLFIYMTLYLKNLYRTHYFIILNKEVRQRRLGKAGLFSGLVRSGCPVTQPFVKLKRKTTQPFVDLRYGLDNFVNERCLFRKHIPPPPSHFMSKGPFSQKVG